MKPPKSFEKLLSQKLNTPVDSKMDRRFWNKFEKQYGKTTSWSFFGWPRLLIPTGSLAILLIGVIFLFKSQKPFEESWVRENNDFAMSETLEDLELLENLEFYEEFDTQINLANHTTNDELDLWFDLLGESNGDKNDET